MLTTPRVFSFRCKYTDSLGEIVCLIFLGYLIQKGTYFENQSLLTLFPLLLSAYLEIFSIKILGLPLLQGISGLIASYLYIWCCFFSLCPPGGAGEAASSGQPHPGSLWKCQNSQKWQLLSIRKTYQHNLSFLSPFVTRTVFTTNTTFISSGKVHQNQLWRQWLHCRCQHWNLYPCKSWKIYISLKAIFISLLIMRGWRLSDFSHQVSRQQTETKQ